MSLYNELIQVTGLRKSIKGTTEKYDLHLNPLCIKAIYINTKYLNSNGQSGSLLVTSDDVEYPCDEHPDDVCAKIIAIEKASGTGNNKHF